LRRLIEWAGSRGSADGRVVLLAESAEALIGTAAARAYPQETGGILLGVWAERRPWVTHAREIDSSDRGPTHYVLPAGKTRALVEQMQHLDSRLGYLGDWHTHPVDAAASPVDRHSLRRLAETLSPDAAAVMLIVARRMGHNYVVDAHVADRRGLRPASIVRTGDLSE
jgi:integrative and conjugative element protein (TIGR02256 family)